MTLEELQVIIEAQTKGFREEINKVQGELKKMTGNVNNEVNKVKSIFKGLGKFIAAVGIGKFFVDSTRQAMKVESAVQQISRTMGESTNQFLKWSKQNALAFNMSQSDAMSYGAIFSNLVSTFSSGSKETLQYTTDLLKASSIIASGTGRTMEDVMERIRSGLLGNTEAIEDLGINVNVAMLQSTEAFKRFANGKSWDQLSFQTQQQIRLFGILEQTSNKFGGAVFSNTNSSLQQFVAILKDVALNIGNAFLPIINVVMPILSNFAMGLRTVTGYIATFMQTLFGKNETGTVTKTMQSATNAAISGASAQNAYNDALRNTGDTAKKTAKEVNRLMGGFDEINTLNKDNNDSGVSVGGVGGASGAGGGIGNLGPLDLGLDEEPDTSGVRKAALKVKAILTDLANFIKEYKEIILSVVGGLIAGLIVYFKGDEILKALKVFLESIKAIPKGIGVAFMNIVSFITAPVFLIAALIGAIVAALIYLWQTSEGFRNACIEAWEGIKEIVITVWESCLKPIFENIKNALLLIWENGLKPLVGAFVDFVEQVAMLLLNLWNSVLQPIFNWLAEILGPVLAGIINVVVNVISAAIQVIMIIIKGILDFLTWGIGLINKLFTLDWKAIWETCKQIVSDIWNNIKSFLSNTWNSISSIAISIWNGIKNTCINVFNGIKNYISGIMNNIKNIFNGIVDFVAGVFTGNWSRAWNGVKNIFKGVFDSLVWIAKAPLNAIISLINGAISGINSMIRMVNKVPGIEIGQIPKIPYLAKGGIIDNPTLAMVGEAGREAVVPLENNTGGLDLLASKLLERMPQGNSSSSFGDGDIILMIDGSVIGKVALKQLRKMQRQGNVTLIPAF